MGSLDSSVKPRRGNATAGAPRCGSASAQATLSAKPLYLPTTPPAAAAAGAMAFPLFDLPAEAVELVLGCVDGLQDKRALRLVCKRTRAAVDSRVVAVRGGHSGAQLSALVQAPWQLQCLYLTGRTLVPADATTLVAARWPALQVLDLGFSNVGGVGAAALSAAHWPALETLTIDRNGLGAAGAASLAAALLPALQELYLNANRLGDAGVAALAAGSWPALRRLDLCANGVRNAGAASLAAGRPSRRYGWPLMASTIRAMHPCEHAGRQP